MSKTLAEKLWKRLVVEAQEAISLEPYSARFLNDLVLHRLSFGEALVATLAARLQDGLMPRSELELLLGSEIEKHPTILEGAALDLQAVLDRDPACNSALEPLLFFKGFQALQAYRIAHSLWGRGQRMSALQIQSIVSQKFSVDIHPAAQIGHGILLDHATNFVVGETAVIGQNVSILHGVTLGGNGKDRGDRHPKVGDGVMIGAHAQLLGNIRIGKGAKIGAGAVVVDSVPSHTTVAGVPAVKVGRTSESMPALEMQQNFTEDSQ